MNEKQYARLSKIFQKSDYLRIGFLLIGKFLTLAVYAAYPVALYAAYRSSMQQLLLSVAVPGISFVLLSIFRNWYNAPRPYEMFDITPIIQKDTKGHSFPSRHVFSAFMIDMVLFSLSIKAGIVYLIFSVVLAIVRVVGGVHFPKDVVAGALCGIIGWFAGVKLIGEILSVF